MIEIEHTPIVKFKKIDLKFFDEGKYVRLISNPRNRFFDDFTLRVSSPVVPSKELVQAALEMGDRSEGCSARIFREEDNAPLKRYLNSITIKPAGVHWLTCDTLISLGFEGRSFKVPVLGFVKAVKSGQQTI